MDWIRLAKDRDQRRAFVNKVICIRRDVMGLEWIGFVWPRTGTRGGPLSIR